MSDTPAVPLPFAPPPLDELKDYFLATMFLMWDPALDASGNPTVTAANPYGCAASSLYTFNVNGKPVYNVTPSACTGSIPVPLQSLTWGYCGDTINTPATQGNSLGPPNPPNTWLLNCSANGTNTIVPVFSDAVGSSSYPTWTAVYLNSAFK